MQILVTVDVSRLQDGFAALKARLANTSPAMATLSEIMADAVDRAFAEEKDPVTDKPWKPLSPAYRARRQKEGSLGTILSRSRTLHNSMEKDHDATTATLIMGGKDAPYARIHQTGGTINRAEGTIKLHFTRRGRFAKKTSKKAFYGMAARAHTITIPQRRYMGVGEDDLEEMKQALVAYLLGNL